jgi:hypothetical protein
MAVTIFDVARIAAINDPVLRNLQITHCYHQLAVELAERIGLEANWCTFATWASRQASQTIRNEDLTRTLEKTLGSEVDVQEAERFLRRVRRVGIRLNSRDLFELMWRAVDPENILARSSDVVGRGNLKVFAEIGHEFARFNAFCLHDASYDQANIDDFTSGLLPGPPPDGQDHLRTAFQRYYQALFEAQPKACSELLLLANLQIGFHEQTRLQPEIVEALEAPVISPRLFTRNLLRTYFREKPWLAETAIVLLAGLGRLIGFDAFIERYLSNVRRLAQRLVTLTMMTIFLPPDVQLQLGKDLPADFPPSLQHISNPELAALLDQIDPTPDSRAESGAKYWGDLPERMHFIADMFRCYHTSAALFEPPFSPDQTAAILEGHIPAGHL